MCIHRETDTHVHIHIHTCYFSLALINYHAQQQLTEESFKFGLVFQWDKCLEATEAGSWELTSINMKQNQLEVK